MEVIKKLTEILKTDNNCNYYLTSKLKLKDFFDCILDQSTTTFVKTNIVQIDYNKISKKEQIKANLLIKAIKIESEILSKKFFIQILPKNYIVIEFPKDILIDPVYIDSLCRIVSPFFYKKDKKLLFQLEELGYEKLKQKDFLDQFSISIQYTFTIISIVLASMIYFIDIFFLIDVVSTKIKYLIMLFFIILGLAVDVLSSYIFGKKRHALKKIKIKNKKFHQKFRQDKSNSNKHYLSGANN